MVVAGKTVSDASAPPPPRGNKGKNTFGVREGVSGNQAWYYLTLLISAKFSLSTQEAGQVGLLEFEGSLIYTIEKPWKN